MTFLVMIASFAAGRAAVIHHQAGLVALFGAVFVGSVVYACRGRGRS